MVQFDPDVVAGYLPKSKLNYSIHSFVHLVGYDSAQVPNVAPMTAQ